MTTMSTQNRRADTPALGKINTALSGLRCIRCHRLWPIDDYFCGCPDCAKEGYPASVAPDFESFPSMRTSDDISGWLAYPGKSLLGEGGTPVIDLPELAAAVGVRKLWIKNEGSNPTGSHKDRMSAALIRRAEHVGARTLAVASSGNAGVSVAAYAARAGLDCVVVTTEGMSPGFSRAITAHGADIIVVPSSAARWELVSARSRSGDWYPATNFTTPAVGSNAFGVDGFRAIAFELFLSFGADQPTDILVPTSRADLLWGIVKGYSDLASVGLVVELPRVHAVEPFPRLSRVFDGEDYIGHFDGQSAFKSLGGTTVTYQAVKALLQARGSIAFPPTGLTFEAHRRLSRLGLYVESSSAIALSGLQLLRQKSLVSEEASVVLIMTSHGYKEDQ